MTSKMFKILFLQFKDNKENVSLRLPGMYLIDQIRPPLQMNLTLYFLDWTNYAEQQKEITSQQLLSSEGQSQGLILIRKCSLRPIIARLMTPFHASTMSTSYM